MNLLYIKETPVSAKLFFQTVCIVLNWFICIKGGSFTWTLTQCLSFLFLLPPHTCILNQTVCLGAGSNQSAETWLHHQHLCSHHHSFLLMKKIWDFNTVSLSVCIPFFLILLLWGASDRDDRYTCTSWFLETSHNALVICHVWGHVILCTCLTFSFLYDFRKDHDLCSHD